MIILAPVNPQSKILAHLTISHLSDEMTPLLFVVVDQIFFLIPSFLKTFVSFSVGNAYLEGGPVEMHFAS